MLFVNAGDEKYGDKTIGDRFDGQTIINADDEKLGSVDKVYININDNNDIYLRANLGGGFLNFGGKDFLVPASKLTGRDNRFFLDLPKSETEMQGRVVPGDGQGFLEGILAPPTGYAEGLGAGIKDAVGGGTGLPGGQFANNTGDWGGRRVTSNSVESTGKVTAIKGHRLYEPGGEQFGTIEEVYCDLVSGKPVLVKVNYGGDPQPGGFFNLFSRGHDVLLSVDNLVEQGEFYVLRDAQALNYMHSGDEPEATAGVIPAGGLA